jgi:hypothetical protein
MLDIILKIDWIQTVGNRNFELNIYPYTLPLNEKLKIKLQKIVKEKFNQIQQSKIKIDEIEFNYYMFYFKTILNLKLFNGIYHNGFYLEKIYSNIEEFTEDIKRIKLFKDINLYYFLYYKIQENPNIINIPEVEFLVNNNEKLKTKFNYLLNAQKFDLI